MTVRIAKPDLMEKADIGAKVTLDQNLRRLEAVGLINIETIGGIQGGNQYTVYLPEEVPTPPSTSPSTGTMSPSPPSGGQKLPPLAPLETRPPSIGLNIDALAISGEPKTSFKTNTEKTDDEAFAPLIAQFRQATCEITGRETSPAEAERWRELGELLVMELKIAAGRTGSVSSVPAFLTEHLRRRLWKKEKRQVEEEGKLVVGSHEPGAKIDALKCPDCFGTGMYYPEGFEKGVARCPHAKLTAESNA